MLGSPLMSDLAIDFLLDQIAGLEAIVDQQRSCITALVAARDELQAVVRDLCAREAEQQTREAQWVARFRIVGES